MRKWQMAGLDTDWQPRLARAHGAQLLRGLVGGLDTTGRFWLPFSRVSIHAASAEGSLA
jgi:hypothetical protein